MLDVDKNVYGSQSFSLSGFAVKTLHFDWCFFFFFFKKSGKFIQNVYIKKYFH